MKQPDASPTLPSTDPTAAFEALGRILFDAQSLTQALGQVAAVAQQIVPQACEVSVTVVERNRALTVAFTGPLALHLDERQYDLDRGPCLDAAVSGHTIALAMKDSATPYPEFTAAARHQGITHTLSVPLPTLTATIGALNLYGDTGQPFDPPTQHTVETLASYSAAFVANLTLHTRTTDRLAQLEEAMKSRAVIEQAKGIIMAREHCTSAQAFTLLTRLSQTRNLKLRDIAAALVDRTSQGG